MARRRFRPARWAAAATSIRSSSSSSKARRASRTSGKPTPPRRKAASVRSTTLRARGTACSSSNRARSVRMRSCSRWRVRPRSTPADSTWVAVWLVARRRRARVASVWPRSKTGRGKVRREVQAVGLIPGGQEAIVGEADAGHRIGQGLAPRQGQLRLQPGPLGAQGLQVRPRRQGRLRIDPGRLACPGEEPAGVFLAGEARAGRAQKTVAGQQGPFAIGAGVVERREQPRVLDLQAIHLERRQVALVGAGPLQPQALLGVADQALQRRARGLGRLVGQGLQHGEEGAQVDVQHVQLRAGAGRGRRLLSGRACPARSARRSRRCSWARRRRPRSFPWSDRWWAAARRGWCSSWR